MYNPLIKALNYALDQLSKVDIDGLSEFKKERQTVFTRNDTKCIRDQNISPRLVQAGYYSNKMEQVQNGIWIQTSPLLRILQI